VSSRCPIAVRLLSRPEGGCARTRPGRAIAKCASRLFSPPPPTGVGIPRICSRLPVRFHSALSTIQGIRGNGHFPSYKPRPRAGIHDGKKETIGPADRPRSVSIVGPHSPTVRRSREAARIRRWRGTIRSWLKRRYVIRVLWDGHAQEEPNKVRGCRDPACDHCTASNQTRGLFFFLVGGDAPRAWNRGRRVPRA